MTNLDFLGLESINCFPFTSFLNSCNTEWRMICCLFDLLSDSVLFHLCILLCRLSRMASPLLWSSMQIGVKYVENWLQMSTKWNSSTSNSLRTPISYTFAQHIHDMFHVCLYMQMY